MYQHINADYYGFRDEEDGVLEKVEAEAERNIRQRVSCNTCFCHSRISKPWDGQSYQHTCSSSTVCRLYNCAH